MNNVTEFKKAEEILREINYDMPKSWRMFNEIKRPVKLTDAQKKLLEFISAGKIVSCPRNMGKTYVLKVYTEWLNWKMDRINHSEADEIITMNECINHEGMYSKRLLKEFMQKNLLHAIQEYNIDLKTLDILQKEIEQEKELDDEKIELEKIKTATLEKYIGKVPSDGKIFF